MTRYLLSELLQVLLASLAGMTLFMLIVGVMREALLQGLGLKQILLLIPYVLPDALRFAIPGTALLTACNVYGRLSGFNEIIAIKAAGISPWAIFWPIAALGVILSLTTVWLNDLTVSWGREGIRRVVIESVEEIAYGKLQQERAFETKGFSIHVQRVEGKRLINPMISFKSTTAGQTYNINAAEAELHADPSANTLTIICRDSEYQIGSTKGRIPGTIERVVSLSDSTRKGGGGGSPADLPMNQITDEVERSRLELSTKRQQQAALAGLSLIHGDFASLHNQVWEPQQQVMRDIQGRIYRLEMEPHRRWSTGFSCFCFVVVGAPLASWFRRSDFLTSFFVCFLPILLGYYPLLMFSIDQAKSGRMPVEIVWIGNIVMLAVGWWLYKKVERY